MEGFYILARNTLENPYPEKKKHENKESRQRTSESVGVSGNPQPELELPRNEQPPEQSSQRAS
jgi:hypothetical protein